MGLPPPNFFPVIIKLFRQNSDDAQQAEVRAIGLRPATGRGRCPLRRFREGEGEMTEISVKTKLWSLIAIMLLFIISVGAVGFVTLDRGAATLKEFVDQDELQNLTDRVHLEIIQLRRFEKDFFLNIGNPEKQQEYLKRYQAIDAAVPQLMGNLADLARADVQLPRDLQAKAGPCPPSTPTTETVFTTPSAV